MATEKTNTTPDGALQKANFQFEELAALARSAAALVKEVPNFGRDVKSVSVVFVLDVLAARASSFASEADAAALAIAGQGESK